MDRLPRDTVSIAALETAVNRLCNLEPSDKRSLIHALALAVEHDGSVTVTEAELLRAIADSLNCPLPPLLASSEERRVGKECVSTCRQRWSTYHYKNTYTLKPRIKHRL